LRETEIWASGDSASGKSSCCYPFRAIISCDIDSGARANNSKLCAVIWGSSLGDRHENWLMVGGGGHGAYSVVACRETTSDGGGEETLSVTCVVDALEESELGGVEGAGWVQRAAEILDSDVSVADNDSIFEELWCSVVGCIGVGK